MSGATGPTQRWLGAAANMVGLTTVLSTLLFYFGYVYSRSQYAYFGIDVDTIGLSTRDYVMRSPQPLLVPLLVLTLLGIGSMLLHVSVLRRIGTRAPHTHAAQRLTTYRRRVAGMAVAGLVLLGVGIVLLFGYPLLQNWAWFDLVEPLVLAVGAALFAYASRLQSLLRPAPNPPAAVPNDPVAQAAVHAARSMRVLRSAAFTLVLIVIVANVFWATATVASWSGRGLAHDNATHFDQLPSVILDTKQRLFLRDPEVEETQLPTIAGQSFRFRYRHMRLLIQGNDRMFLVPDRWSASDSTLVVTLDADVRVQFQFRNERP